MVSLSPSDASAEGGATAASNERSPRGRLCKIANQGASHTRPLCGLAQCIFSFTPPSADASDGDSDITEPSALHYLNHIRDTLATSRKQHCMPSHQYASLDYTFDETLRQSHSLISALFLTSSNPCSIVLLFKYPDTTGFFYFLCFC